MLGRSLLAIFIEQGDTELMELASQYLVILMMFFWAQTFIHVFRFALQGIGYPSISVISSTAEMAARAAIGLWIIPAFGFTGACFSNPLAWIAADACILPMYFLTMKKHPSQPETSAEA